ncbi:hypothetical protein C3E80_16910 [Cronobacter malonaticus]|uniref:Uncharacterized protein n=1 Tax=Cronobacter malonaticus TaxID=413503 RepID=A0A423XU40_9ENTR|nr:hypothetical protein C3E80_16910 [Cronobacter malonaticus]RRA40539.1 hypothetical protein C4882_11995 [Cronobacter malonaticus]
MVLASPRSLRLPKERLPGGAQSRKTVSRSFGHENSTLCFRITRCLRSLNSNCIPRRLAPKG